MADLKCLVDSENGCVIQDETAIVIVATALTTITALTLLGALTILGPKIPPPPPPG